MSTEKNTARAALDPADFQDLARELGLGLVKILPRSGSTNTELAALAAEGHAGDLSVYFTEHQHQGKGRLGREWLTPQGSAITLSVLCAPGNQMPAGSLSWYTMLAAVAWSQAVAAQTGVEARIKWPNDVLAGDQKICGILAQLVSTPTGFAVVVGTGMNVDQGAEELPVSTATSLRLASGAPVDRGALLSEYLRSFARLDAAFRTVAGNPLTPLPGYARESLRDLIASRLATLGHGVRVEFPDGSQLEGVAIELAEDGALCVRAADGITHRVLAGDVHHVRRADGKYA